MEIKEIENKILNVDCLDILKQLPDKCIDLVLTDPPYLHESGGRGTMLLGESLDRDKYNMGELSDFGEVEINKFLDETKRVNKKNEWYIFCSEKQMVYYLNWVVKNKLKYNILTWNKPLSVLNHERYSTNIEYIVRIYDNGCKLNKLENNKFSYYSKYKTFNQLRGKEKIHGSQKPIKILTQFIELSSNENDIILDTFSGSGTTAVACHNLKRRFICIEKDYDYWKASVERLKNAQAQLKLF